MKLISRWGHSRRMDIRHEARGLLEELSEIVNEAAYLCTQTVLGQYILINSTCRTIRMYSQVGRIAPLHASAVGKSFWHFR